jgi:hypothetical protein
MHATAEIPAKSNSALADWQHALAFIERWGIADCILQFTPPRHGDPARLLLASVNDIERCFAGSGAELNTWRGDASAFAEINFGSIEVAAVAGSDRKLGAITL